MFTRCFNISNYIAETHCENIKQTKTHDYVNTCQRIILHTLTLNFATLTLKAVIKIELKESF